MPDLKPENLDEELRTLFEKLEDHLALQNTAQETETGLDPKNYEMVRRYHILEALVVRACYEALTYAERHPDGLDAKEQRRQRDREVLKKIPSQIKAISTLQIFLEQFPEYASHALVQCHQLDHIQVSIKEKLPLNEVWHNFFTAYSNALQKKQIPAKKFPRLT